MNKNKNLGFTLIELIIVIVLLGVLSVVAAPRLVDLRTDAVVASLEGMEAAVTSGVALANAKAIIQNQINGDGTIELDDSISIPSHSGYPISVWSTSLSFVVGLEAQAFSGASEVCEDDCCAKGNQTSANTDEAITITGRITKIFPRGYTFQDLCAVHYVNNTDGSAPIIGISTSGC